MNDQKIMIELLLKQFEVKFNTRELPSFNMLLGDRVFYTVSSELPYQILFKIIHEFDDHKDGESNNEEINHIVDKEAPFNFNGRLISNSWFQSDCQV